MRASHSVVLIAILFLIAWPVVAIQNRLLISRRRDDLLTLLFDIDQWSLDLVFRILIRSILAVLKGRGAM